MIAFLGKKVGVEINDKSYFSLIRYNALNVKEIQVNGTTVAFGGHIPQLINDLKEAGCEKILEIYAAYPIMYKCLLGSAGLLFDGNSYFISSYSPSSTDVSNAKFTINVTTRAFQTIYCSRKSGKNSFSTFIASNGLSLRPDFGNTLGTVSFTMNEGTLYNYEQKNGLAVLNNVSATTTTSSFVPTAPISIGASYETYTTANLSVANKLNGTTIHSVSFMKEDNKYGLYLVPVDDNKVADLVTGEIYNNSGSGNAILMES